MWLRSLSAIVLGLFLYAGATLMFNNVITSTTDAAMFTKTAVPVVIAVVVTGITAISLFSHS